MRKQYRLLCLLSFAPLLALSARAAALDIAAGAGAEFFDWHEYSGGTQLLEERGTRFNILDFRLQSDKARGALWGYHGKLYAGNVTYNGQTQFTHLPATTTTSYAGINHEGLLGWRWHPANLYLEFQAMLGGDSWERDINGQIEDYAVVYVRNGVNISAAGEHGWYAGGGWKLPVYTHENAHLTDSGYTSNPSLTPGKRMSAYVNAGYRFARHWSVDGYYDSYRFSQSETEVVSDASGQRYVVVQPKSNMDTIGVNAHYHF